MKYIFKTKMEDTKNLSEQFAKLNLKEKNHGTCAGGAQTNINGLSFEKKTDIEGKLLANGFIKKDIPGKNGKYDYYFIHKIGSLRIIYCRQSGFSSFFDHFFKISNFKHKKPDEAFIIIEYPKLKTPIYHLKILEKKNQNCAGSVDEKLKTGAFVRREYELLLNLKNGKFRFEVSYAFCLSKFLEECLESDNARYQFHKKILFDDGIKIFYGDNENYPNEIYEWVINSKS